MIADRDSDWDGEWDEGRDEGSFSIKQCPQCLVFVDGARILCECGFDFEEVHLPKEVVQFLEKKGYNNLVEVRLFEPIDEDLKYFGYISKKKKGSKVDAFTAAKVNEDWWIEIFTKSTTHEIKKETKQ